MLPDLLHRGRVKFRNLLHAFNNRLAPNDVVAAYVDH